MRILQQGFSRRDWADLYYDGEIDLGYGFDEDMQEIVELMDYWDFENDVDDKGYIEDSDGINYIHN